VAQLKTEKTKTVKNHENKKAASENKSGSSSQWLKLPPVSRPNA
jgi:hypothetical protein